MESQFRVLNFRALNPGLKLRMLLKNSALTMSSLGRHTVYYLNCTLTMLSEVEALHGRI